MCVCLDESMCVNDQVPIQKREGEKWSSQSFLRGTSNLKYFVGIKIHANAGIN